MEDRDDIPVGIQRADGCTAKLPRKSERRWVLYAGLLTLGAGVAAAVAIWSRRPSVHGVLRGSDDYRAAASADGAAHAPAAPTPIWKRNAPRIPPLDDWYVAGSATTLADAKANLGTAWRFSGASQTGDLTAVGIKFALVPSPVPAESLEQAIAYRREQADNRLKHVSGKTTVFWRRSCEPIVGKPNAKAWESNLRGCETLRGQPIHVVASVAKCTGPAGTALLETGSYPVAKTDILLTRKPVFELRLVALSVLCASLQTSYVVETQKSIQELQRSIEELKKTLTQEYGRQLAEKDKEIQRLEGQVKDKNAEIARLQQSNLDAHSDASP